MAPSSLTVPGKVRLWLLNPLDPSLERVSALIDPELGEIKSVRGRGPDDGSDLYNFPWSPAVRALAVLLLETRACEPGKPRANLSGEDGSLASSLDYALSKLPAWLSDLFGVCEDGTAIARQIFLRRNPERRRAGPVIVSVNETLLPYSNIEIYLDDVLLTAKSDFLTISDRIKDNYFVRKSPLKAAKTRPLSASPVVTYPNDVELIGPELHIPDTRPSYQYYTTALDLEREYLRGLRRRVIDRKFQFIGKEAAEAWIDVCRSSQYRYFGDSVSLIEKSTERVTALLPDKVNYLAIWPGTGVKERILLGALTNSKREVTAAFVDTSEEILAVSTAALKHGCPPVACYIGDFLQPGVLSAIAERSRSSALVANLLVFFGHTLGTQPQAEMLQTVRSAMKPQDFVLFGITVAPPKVSDDQEQRLDYFISQYDQPHFKQQIISSLRHCSIDPSAGILEVDCRRDRFFPTFWIIEQYFRFRAPVTVRYAGEEIPFCEDERLQVGAYYQYTREGIQKLLHGQGFTIIELFDGQASAIEILCKRR